MAVAEGLALYVYGVARAGDVPGGARGVLDAAVNPVSHRSLAAIVSPVPAGTVRAKRRDLLRHSDVLQDAFTRGPVLPLRFGTLFPHEDALVDELLEPRHDELSALLDRLDGLGELRLRVSYHDRDAVLADIVRGDPALAKLRDRARVAPPGDPRLLQLGEAVAARFAGRRAGDGARVLERLAPIAQEAHVDDPQDELEVLRASLLVSRGDQRRFDEVLESVALRERHLLQIVCTGPLPPHSFVELGGSRWAS